MINYLRKVFTGYKRLEKIMEGKTTTYYYIGQLVRFSPITMLKELRIKQESESFIHVPIDIPIENTLREIEPAAGFPEAKIKVFITEGNSQLKVYRHVAKVGQFNTSFYKFYVDDELVAVFLRKYDYGRSFLSTLRDLYPQVSVETFKEEAKYLFYNKNSDNQVIAEFFGHTQVWIILNGKKLRSLTDIWTMNYSQNAN